MYGFEEHFQISDQFNDIKTDSQTQESKVFNQLNPNEIGMNIQRIKHKGQSTFFILRFEKTDDM